METEEMIAELVIGIFLIFLSYQVGMKGNIACLLYTSDAADEL